MDDNKLAELIDSILADLDVDNKSVEEIYEILQTRLACIKAEYDKEREEKKSNSTGLSKFFNALGNFNVNVFDFFGFILLNKAESIKIDKDKLKVLAACISKLQQEDKVVAVENAHLKENADNEKVRELTEMYKKVFDDNLHLNSLLAKQDNNLYFLIQRIFGFIGENPETEEIKSFSESVSDALIGLSKKIEILWTIDEAHESDYFDVRKTKLKVDRSVRLPCICADGKVVLLGLKYMEV